jgi:hypothetical protein
VEKNEFLGGTPVASLVPTMGYGGHDKERWVIGGFFKEFRNRMIGSGYLIPTKRKGWEPMNPEGYKLVAFNMLSEAGVEIQCGLWPLEIEMKEERLIAIICDSKLGRCVIEANAFVDATGDGDIGYYAGCSFDVGRHGDNKDQPANLCYLLGNVNIERTGDWLASKGRRGFWRTDEGLPYLNMTGLQEEVSCALEEGSLTIQRDHVASVFTIPGLRGVVGVNFGRIFLDEKNVAQRYIEGMKQMEEGTNFFRRYVPGFEDCQLIVAAPQVGIRSSRRIRGLYTLTEQDLLNLRQFEDVIAQGCYMIDIHLPDSIGTLKRNIPRGKHYDIPLRSIIASQKSNLFLAGRCISADFNAISALRVQVICMATGHSAGVAAGLLCRIEQDARKLSYKGVQAELLSQGAILD